MNRFFSNQKRTNMKPMLPPMLFVAASLSACAQLQSTSHAPELSQNNSSSLLAARKALSEGEAATSLSIAHGVLSMRPNDVAATVAEGDADAQLGNRHTADMEYRHALQLDPTNAGAHLGLGKLMMATNAHAAELTFREVLASNPSNPAALTDLGVALDLQERHQEAQANYKAAMDIDPNLTSARVDMAVSLAISGDPDKAESLLRDASESGAMPARVRADYALAEVMAGHPEDAAQTLQADLSKDEAKASVAAMEVLKTTTPAPQPVAALPPAPVAAAAPVPAQAKQLVEAMPLPAPATTLKPVSAVATAPLPVATQAASVPAAPASQVAQVASAPAKPSSATP
jgi:Flp pilus assembly protein TadD